MRLGVYFFSWLALFLSRQYLIHPYCNELTCQAGSLWAFDQFSLYKKSRFADDFSSWTQNLSGVFALLITMYCAYPSIRKVLHFVKVLFSITCINGFFIELAHAIVQRPRPFVYTGLTEHAANFIDYTSFYSGHTSFSAAMCTAACIIMYKNKPSKLGGLFVITISLGLILVTAYCRIMAGRHFLSDTVAGALAGCTIAWLHSAQILLKQ